MLRERFTLTSNTDSEVGHGPRGSELTHSCWGASRGCGNWIVPSAKNQAWTTKDGCFRGMRLMCGQTQRFMNESEAYLRIQRVCAECDSTACNRFLWWWRDFLCPKYNCRLWSWQMRIKKYNRQHSLGGSQDYPWTGHQSKEVKPGKRWEDLQSSNRFSTIQVADDWGHFCVSQSSVWKVLFQPTSVRGYQ